MALTKTTSIDVIDDWQSVAGGTVTVGNNKSLADSFQSQLYLELAPIEAVAQAGVNIEVEVSYANELFVPYSKFTSSAFTASTDTLEEAASATDTTIELVGTGFGDGERVLMWNSGTPANSEVVYFVDNSAGVTGQDYDLASPLENAHADTSPVFECLDQWVITLPDAVSQVRTIIHNIDADCDIAFTTRISKVTSLT